MAIPFRKSTGWSQFGFVCMVAIGMMIVDARTTWLQTPRNVMSIAIAPIQLIASLPAAVGREVGETLSAKPDLQIAYDNLRNDYFQLKSEMLLLRGLEEENEGLRSLLDASERLQEKITLAELINVSIDPYDHVVLVARGLSHGIYEGQAVIDDQGVIGQVTKVMPFNSRVVLITDPGHALPVQLQRTGLRTVIYGTGSVSQLKVPFLNQNSDIQVGDLLVSSGLGGRFPNGYPVAIIEEVAVIDDQAFMRILASPVAKLDRSNHVLLLSREAGDNSAIISDESNK